MSQLIQVPGASQDAFNALSDQIGKLTFIKSNGDSTTQTFNISNKGFSLPVFMLSVGYESKGMCAILYLNQMNQSGIAFDKISGVGNLDISSITYDGNGTIEVTFSSNPYRKACLTVLNW